MMLLRRLVPYALLPLALLACGLASAPWLRAFPSGVVAVPLFGAAVLSVLIPLIVVGVGVRPLWLTALIDLVLCVFFELLATLRDLGAVDRLWAGVVHGPSQILSFALPLVSPRELMVAPVALCWLSGAIIGECVARAWHSPLPYLAAMITFGLSYAATARGISSIADGRRYDTLLAASLLLTLLLMRAAQAWVVQDESAETTQPDGVLPLRSLAIGGLIAVLVTALAAAAVQASVFTGPPTTPARTPPVDQSNPLTPVSFISGLRPDDPKSPGTPLFKVSVDRETSRYVAVANVNFYDGDGWSFNRTFRPSGGVIPSEVDPTMRTRGRPVTQTYTLGSGAMTSAPWMPYLERAQRVSGVSVNIDPGSGMIVPAHRLHPGDQYTVQSRVPARTFDQLGSTAQISTSALPDDRGLAGELQQPLATLVRSLEAETGTSSINPVTFLQAVATDFRTKSGLAGGTATPAASSGTSTATPSSTATPTPSPSSSTPHTGGTAFADVLASIRSYHSATPEQYATLLALIARKLFVPVRVVTGFRIVPPGGGTSLPAGSYEVTSAEAWTGVEVPVTGQGWVVLDPSPSTYGGQRSSPPPGRSASNPPASSPAPSAQLTNGNQGNPPAPVSKVPGKSSVSPVSVAVLVLIGLAAVAVLIVAIMLLRKWLRVRRRRRRGDPRRRLLGAWQESLDFLQEAGLPELASLTTAEVVSVTGERFGPEPAEHVKELGEAANRAIFSPTRWVDKDQADAAWRSEAALTRIVRRRLDWPRRVSTRFRYHPNPRRAPLVGPTSWVAEARARAAAQRAGKHRRSSPRHGLARRR